MVVAALDDDASPAGQFPHRALGVPPIPVGRHPGQHQVVEHLGDHVPVTAQDGRVALVVAPRLGLDEPKRLKRRSLVQHRAGVTSRPARRASGRTVCWHRTARLDSTTDTGKSAKASARETAWAAPRGSRGRSASSPSQARRLPAEPWRTTRMLTARWFLPVGYRRPVRAGSAPPRCQTVTSVMQTSSPMGRDELSSV